METDKLAPVYPFKMPPTAKTFEEMEQEHRMLVSMERQREASRFPWKRKGYRKHVK